jgi:hypothetical protein
LDTGWCVRRNPCPATASPRPWKPPPAGGVARSCPCALNSRSLLAPHLPRNRSATGWDALTLLSEQESSRRRRESNQQSLREGACERDGNSPGGAGSPPCKGPPKSFPQRPAQGIAPCHCGLMSTIFVGILRPGRVKTFWEAHVNAASGPSLNFIKKHSFLEEQRWDDWQSR